MNKLGFALYIFALVAGVYAIVVMHRQQGPRPAKNARRPSLWRSARHRSSNPR